MGAESCHTVYTRVLELNKITVMAALPKYDRLIVLNNGTILSYSLKTFVDVAQSRVPAANLEHSLVKLTPKHNGQVNFVRIGRLAGKDMRKLFIIASFISSMDFAVVYDTRSFRSSTIHTMEIRLDGLKEVNKACYDRFFSIKC
jgi:hypothetical protein